MFTILEINNKKRSKRKDCLIKFYIESVLYMYKTFLLNYNSILILIVCDHFFSIYNTSNTIISAIEI